MKATGIIFAVLDCDLDSVVAFNRWYDLEHVPPNVALPGVMLGHRYVATPELHAARLVDETSAFAGQRGSFLTIYTLCEPPAPTVATMSTIRDKLYAENRMSFPAEKKTVRDGDAMPLLSATGAAHTLLPPDEVPFVGHTGLLVVQRRCTPEVAAWYQGDRAAQLVKLPGVHGVATYRSSRADDIETDLVFIEGDPAPIAAAARADAPHHRSAHVLVDTAFLLIQPLVYPWAAAMAASSLPKTIG